MKQHIKYTRQMYRYLSWCSFQEIYGVMEWVKDDAEEINELVEEARKFLTNEEIKVVENRALRMKNDYVKLVMDDLQGCYEGDFDNDDFFNSPFPVIEFDEKFYNIWKVGVAKRLTVQMKYDSNTSGVTDRLVDPYQSSAPYGKGYCHKNKEVRRFRFDRVIDIKLTDKKFEKLTGIM